MFTKKTNRFIAFILALLISVTSLPAVMLVSGTEEFLPENLLSTHLESAEGILFDKINNTARANTKFDENGAIAASTDGNKEVHADVWGWDASTGVGALYILDGSYYVGKVNIVSGLVGYPDTYRVYASDSLSDLYTEQNQVTAGFVCENTERTLNVNKKVKYIAFVFESDGGRVKEFEAWSAEDTTLPEFVSENLLSTHLESAGGILLDYYTLAVTANAKFDENGAIAAATDGDKASHTDVYGWNSETGVGVIYTLDAEYFVGKINITSGLVGYPDKYRVYAAAELGELYKQDSLVVSSLVCENEEQTLDVNKKIRYIAFVFESDGGRVKEFEAWSAENTTPPEFVSENLLSTHLSSFEGIILNYADKSYFTNEKFNENGAISAAIDGDKATHVDVYGWNGENGVGVIYTLDDIYYANKITVTSGLVGYPDKYLIFASNDRETLFDDANKVASGVVCESAEREIEFAKDVKFIAFIFESDGGRVKEFELWSAEKGDDPESDPNPDPNPNPNPNPNPDPDPEPEPEPPEDIVLKDENSANFIRRHIDSYSEVSQSINSKEFQDNKRFGADNPEAALIAIDGNTSDTFDVWGALDWEYPINVGVKYNLDAYYNVDKAVIMAGTPDLKAVFDVYASDNLGALYNEESRVAEGVVCKGERVEIPIGKKIQYVIFLITDYNQANNNNIIKISEFDLIGSDKAIEKEVITWPSVPNGTNILANATASKIIAPAGDLKGTKEYDYGFMDGNDKSDLKYLTDGVTSKHYDIWSLAENDKPGVLYDLGGYYDLKHLHAWAGAENSEMLVINGYKIFASDSLENLYKSQNMIFSYSNSNDSTNEIGVNGDFKRIRYVAFLLTDSIDGAWRMREFAVFGTKAADQTAPVEQKSIIEGLDAEYYGVATTDLKDPIYMGASAFVEALTDGKRDAVEFWGGSDIENSKFVFIYNLYENYDLTGIDIYAFADNIEEDSGIHKGIRSAKVFAARKFDDLFAESNGIVLKTDYVSKTEPDETSLYSTDALPSWKAARYVAFVFTIGDSRYGACRLEELKVYGSLSATQDVEQEEARLPQYIDVESDNGVIARIFAYNATDDLSKLNANLKANISKDAADLSFVEESLSGYKASSLYDIKIVDASGADVALGGRRVRLSIPEKDLTKSIACVDDFGAEIVSSGVLESYITVETETLRKYAVVSGDSAVNSVGGSSPNLMLILTVCLGVLSLLAVGTTVLLGVKSKKK